MLKPGKAVRVYGYTVQGKYDVDWKGYVRYHPRVRDNIMLTRVSQVTVGFDNGKSLTFPTGGTVSNMQYSDAWVFFEDEEIDKAQSAIESGDGVLFDSKMKGVSMKTLSGNTQPGVSVRRFVA